MDITVIRALVRPLNHQILKI